MDYSIQERRMRTEKRRQRELRRKRQRRRQLIFLTVQGIFLIVVIILFVEIKQMLSQVDKLPTNGGDVVAELVNGKGNLVGSGNGGLQGGDYVEQCGLVAVDAPIKRTLSEALVRLESLSEENELIGEILQDASSYPEDMLEALANNPEMADFVAGYKDSDGSVTGGLTEKEIRQEHPLFLQWDPRWGYAAYGDDSNVGLAGCGPTCLSMALFYLTGDETLTPDKIASYAMENGYYMPGTGTLWALIEDVPGQYGVAVNNLEISESAMKKALDEGKVLISTMRPGDFTAAGHFIVIYGYNEDGFLVNDPNCVARSRTSWEFDRIGSQMKQLWALG